jgi:hypothetical protein
MREKLNEDGETHFRIITGGIFLYVFVNTKSFIPEKCREFRC